MRVTQPIMLIEEHDCYLGGLFTSAPTRTVTDCAILPALNLAQWPNRNIGGKDGSGAKSEIGWLGFVKIC